MNYLNNFINTNLNIDFLDKIKGRYSKVLPSHICSEIGHFLSEYADDDCNSILWVQQPIECFSTNSEINKKIYIELYSALIYFLRCSLCQIKYNTSSLDYPGTWYHKGDTFYLIPNNDEPFYILRTKAADASQLGFDWKKIPNRGRCALKKEQKREIIKQAKSIYKITSLPEKSNINVVAKNCSEELKVLEIPSMYKRTFASALVMSSSIPYAVRSYAGKYIYPIVEVLNTENDTPDNIDIAVLWGNNALDRVQDIVNRLQVNGLGTIKKIIYIGAKPNDYLLNQNPRIITLPFDFVRRCLGYKKVAEPKCVVIDFPWLMEALSTLEQVLEALLEVEIIDLDEKKYIYNFFRRQFCDIRFSIEAFTKLKREYQGFISDVFNGFPPDEIVESINNWIHCLPDPPEYNPKYQLAKSQNASLVITPRRSIRRQTREVTQKQGMVIIDAPIHRRYDYCDSNAISELWSFLPYYSIIAVYYSKIEDVPRKTFKNIFQDAIFKQDIGRFEDGTSRNIVFSDNFEQVLDDYLFYHVSQHSYTESIYSRPTCVIFSDNSSANIFGHIIVHITEDNLEQKNILDLSDSDVGKTITYYISDNELYSKLIRHVLPTGKSVDDYSDIWKDALRRYVKPMTKDERSAFCKRFDISWAILKNQIDGKSKFMQKEGKMKRILELLTSEMLLSYEEAKYILASRLCLKGTSISFGAKLKEDLLSYFMSKELSNFLQDVLDTTNYKITDLLKEFIFTKTIKEINR